MQYRENKQAKPHRKSSGKHPLTNLTKVVKDARVSQGLTQQDLADRSGVSLSFIRKFEQGSNSIMLHKLLVLIEFLGLDLRVDRRKVHL